VASASQRQEPVTGFGECGDEPSDSRATEIVTKILCQRCRPKIIKIVEI
jgi:hypothetical protein